MRITLINVPHPSIGSRIPDDHLPPLGLLSVAGPLIDAGFKATLIDGEFGPMTDAQLVQAALASAPDFILFGHSGSTSAHPIITRLAAQLKQALPHVMIIYGGVFPTYHWRDILKDEPAIDVIVRGEGEASCLQLVRAVAQRQSLADVRGIAYRTPAGDVVAHEAADVIADLDQYRIAWELIDFNRYSYWGGQRAVVVQFSRGCPHLCTYCGQRGFWSKWRYRDPVKFAQEIARLHREHGVEVFNFADENPTAARRPWRAFLEALIAENINVTLVGSTRAGDIVRDADILHLYKKAGWTRFLLGLESPDESTLEKIRKGTTASTDRQAIQLLRQHGILSMATWVLGFEEETWRDCWRGLRTLLSYDPDQVQLLYVTPHRWTPYYKEAQHRQVIQTDQRKWDYKHQVLSTRHLSPWQVMLCFKFIEAVLQLRPKAIRRTFFNRDPHLRHAMRWYTKMGRLVWPYEIWHFLFGDRRRVKGPTVAEFWGSPLDSEEYSMRTSKALRADAQI